MAFKYEYLVISTTGIMGESRLNQYGEIGWQLVAIVPEGSVYRYTFIRVKENKTSIDDKYS